MLEGGKNKGKKLPIEFLSKKKNCPNLFFCKNVFDSWFFKKYKDRTTAQGYILQTVVFFLRGPLGRFFLNKTFAFWNRNQWLSIMTLLGSGNLK